MDNYNSCCAAKTALDTESSDCNGGDLKYYTNKKCCYSKVDCLPGEKCTEYDGNLIIVMPLIKQPNRAKRFPNNCLKLFGYIKLR